MHAWAWSIKNNEALQAERNSSCCMCHQTALDHQQTLADSTTWKRLLNCSLSMFSMPACLKTSAKMHTYCADPSTAYSECEVLAYNAVHQESPTLWYSRPGRKLSLQKCQRVELSDSAADRLSGLAGKARHHIQVVQCTAGTS